MFVYQQQDDDLNQKILTGRAMEAFEEYYADDVVMQENNAPPTVGKAENRARELAFFAKIVQFNGAALVARAADGDTSFSEWTMDYVVEGGIRVQSVQVARRTWKDGKIVAERFFYGT